jgi:hypothetical protein
MQVAEELMVTPPGHHLCRCQLPLRNSTAICRPVFETAQQAGKHGNHDAMV